MHGSVGVQNVGPGRARIVKSAIIGAACAVLILIEVWANLNPIRERLGLSETSSAAVYRQPRTDTERQEPPRNQRSAEIGPSSAATNPSANKSGGDSQKGNGLDITSWIQAISAFVTGVATIVLVRITGRQASISEGQLSIANTDRLDKRATCCNGDRRRSLAQAG